MSQTNSEVPNAAAFRNALLALRPEITPAQLQMLTAHCQAQGHRLTATELARAAAFANYSAANLQYGLLGRTVGTYLHFTPRLRHNGEPVWTSVLATGESPSESEMSEHYVWTMRPEVVEALCSLPWGMRRDDQGS